MGNIFRSWGSGCLCRFVQVHLKNKALLPNCPCNIKKKRSKTRTKSKQQMTHHRFSKSDSASIDFPTHHVHSRRVNTHTTDHLPDQNLNARRLSCLAPAPPAAIPCTYTISTTSKHKKPSSTACLPNKNPHNRFSASLHGGRELHDLTA